MNTKDFKFLYTVEDINKAFDLGFESAIYVLEKSIGLSYEGQNLTTTPKRGGIKGDPKRVIFSAKF